MEAWYSKIMYRFKRDEFQKARGGRSRVLDVCCEACSAHVAYDQKDGSGILKRMYIDRFIDVTPSGAELTCGSCHQILGTFTEFKKENRPAYRLYVGAITKKIIRVQDI